MTIITLLDYFVENLLSETDGCVPMGPSFIRLDPLTFVLAIFLIGILIYFSSYPIKQLSLGTSRLPEGQRDLLDPIGQRLAHFFPEIKEKWSFCRQALRMCLSRRREKGPCSVV